MPEIVNCPQCQRQLRVPEELLGKKVKCPSCGTTFTAASAAPSEPPPAPAADEEAVSTSRKTAEDEYRIEPRDEDSEVRPRRRRRRQEDSDDEPYGRPSRGEAMSLVSGPAIGLLVCGILGCLFSACGLVSNLAGVGMNAGMPPGGGRAGGPDQFVNLFGGVVGLVQAGLGLVIAILVILGSLKMKRLESYGWAMTSAILPMIPCLMPCCLWGLPIGIWAIVTLNKPEVKDAFS